MKSRTLIRIFFCLVAAYDGILGAAFLVAPLSVFQWYGVTPPNHVGYVQFPALLLIVFAAMFVQIALDPFRNRNLIPYGVMLKVAYSGIVFRYWITTGIPDMWKPFAVIDAVTAVVFVWAWMELGKESAKG